MKADQRSCMDVAEALALLATAARGGADRDLRTAPGSGTHGVAALVGAIILMARTSVSPCGTLEIAIDALRLAQRTINADRSGKAGDS